MVQAAPVIPAGDQGNRHLEFKKCSPPIRLRQQDGELLETMRRGEAGRGQHRASWSSRMRKERSRQGRHLSAYERHNNTNT